MHAASLQLQHHEPEEDHVRDRSHSVDDVANTTIAHDHLVKPSEIRSRLRYQLPKGIQS